MLQPPPAEPGAPVDEVDTPALLIDLDALEIPRYVTYSPSALPVQIDNGKLDARIDS